jgi:uncharacterized membrane protein
MTEIDVPDWVVEAAMDAYAKVNEDNGEPVEYFPDAMIAALTAALGAWVVPVACAARWEIEILNNTTVNSAEAWSLDTLDAHDVTLYTLRQEKPE